MRSKQWVRVVGIVLLVVLLARLDVASVIRSIQDSNGYLITLAASLNLPMVFLKSLRWRFLLQSQRIEYSKAKAFLAYFGSIYIGLLTPGRLGEFVKALHVKQDRAISLGKAFSSVLSDRLFDLYVLLMVGGTALISLSAGQNVVAFVITIAFLTVPVGIFLHDGVFASLLRLAGKLGWVGEKLTASDGLLLELRAGLKQLSVFALLRSSILTALAYVIFFSQCYLLAVALGLNAGFVSISFAVALGSLITLLPISISGLGTRETAIIAYLSTVGIAREPALSFSLLVFFTFYLFGGLIGAVAWFIKPVPINVLRTTEANLQ